jgi:hypothetical protein
MRMRNNRPLLLQALGVAVALLILYGAAQANGKTIYVHILDGDDARGDALRVTIHCRTTTGFT